MSHADYNKNFMNLMLPNGQRAKQKQDNEKTENMAKKVVVTTGNSLLKNISKPIPSHIQVTKLAPSPAEKTSVGKIGNVMIFASQPKSAQQPASQPKSAQQPAKKTITLKIPPPAPPAPVVETFVVKNVEDILKLGKEKEQELRHDPLAHNKLESAPEKNQDVDLQPSEKKQHEPSDHSVKNMEPEKEPELDENVASFEYHAAMDIRKPEEGEKRDEEEGELNDMEEDERDEEEDDRDDSMELDDSPITPETEMSIKRFRSFISQITRKGG